MTSRRSHYVFTKNIDEKDDSPITFHDTKMRYLVYQREIGKGTSHHHYQGYVQFKKPISLRSASLLIPKAHIEVAQGSPEQCKAYSTKNETRAPGCKPVEQGTMSGQGTRTDWSMVRSSIEKGASELDLALEYTGLFIRHYKGMTKIRKLIRDSNAHPYRQVKAICYWGPSGTGKTFRIYDRYKGDIKRLYRPDLSTQTVWFDGYDGQEAILFDDYKGQIPLQSLLQILDPYPKNLPVKGDFVLARYTRVFFTSNTDPSGWYPYASNEEQSALHRRLIIKHVIGVPPVFRGQPDWTKTIGVRTSGCDNGGTDTDEHKSDSIRKTLPKPPVIVISDSDSEEKEIESDREYADEIGSIGEEFFD